MGVIYPRNGNPPFVAFGAASHTQRRDCKLECMNGSIAQFNPRPVKFIIADARDYELVPRNPLRPRKRRKAI
jgi:hypothetical protein